MKNFTFFCATILTMCGTVAANDYVSEATDAGVSNAIQKCNGNGVFDVYILSDKSLDMLKQNSGITVNDYRLDKDQNTTIFRGGNIESIDHKIDGLDNNDQYVLSRINGEKNQWWAGMYIKNNATAGSRDFTHINKDTHIHVALWTDSQILSDSKVKVHFLKKDGKDDNAPQVYLCSDASKTDGKLPTAGALQPEKWVAMDMTYGDIENLMADKGMTLDYSRYQDNNSKLVETMGFEPPTGQDGNGVNAEKGHAARFAIDALYFYTPTTVQTGVADVSENCDQILIGNRTISTTGHEGIELYNASGLIVEKVSDNILSIENLPKGIYIVKAGKKTMKIAL